MLKILRWSAPVLLLGAWLPVLPGQGNFPPPPVPAGNPITTAKALLGKALFWDEQLSSSRSVACATCHMPGAGGSDPRARLALHPGPDGVFGTADDVHGSPGIVRQDAAGHFVVAVDFGIQPQVTARKAPSVINAAYQNELFWDGRADATLRDPVAGAVLLAADAALENQAAAPPVSDREMSHFGRTWSEIAQDLANRQPLLLADRIPATLQAFVAGQTYAALFQQAFGSAGVTPARVVMALATYQRTLVSDQSPFDRYLAGQGSLTSQQTQGLNAFLTRCSSCHTDVLPAVLTTGPVLNDFRNIGVRPVAEDPGRAAVTSNPLDLGRFKVPGLRNVALRAPYFHTGGVATLGEVIDFYARGGDFHQNQDPLVQSIPGTVSVADRLTMVAFLQSLTDARVQNELPPFDRPRLWSEGAHVPQVFGVGSVGSGGLRPRLVAVQPPYPGNPRFTIGLDRAAPAALHLLALDLHGSPVPTVLLGQNLYLLATPALCFLGQGLTQGTGAGGGWSSATLPIPSAPPLRGLTLFGQWLLFDATGPNGFAVSDAFSSTVF